MRSLEHSEFAWIFVATLVITWTARIFLMQHLLAESFLSFLGLLLVIALVWMISSHKSNPTVLWDIETGTLAILRKWSVEVLSARLMGSVPIGIDLSHSAKKVLRSVYSRFSSGPAAEVVFFVARPLGNNRTRVGFLVKRSRLLVLNGIREVDSLRKQLVKDVAILESAMRAAYPHLPVTRAGLDDMIMTSTGGIESNVGTR